MFWSRCENTKHDVEKEDIVLKALKSKYERKNIQDRLFYSETRAQQHKDLKMYFKDGEINIFKKWMQIYADSFYQPIFCFFSLKPLVL